MELDKERVYERQDDRLLDSHAPNKCMLQLFADDLVTQSQWPSRNTGLTLLDRLLAAAYSDEQLVQTFRTSGLWSADKVEQIVQNWRHGVSPSDQEKQLLATILDKRATWYDARKVGHSRKRAKKQPDISLHAKNPTTDEELINKLAVPADPLRTAEELSDAERERKFKLDLARQKLQKLNCALLVLSDFDRFLLVARTTLRIQKGDRSRELTYDELRAMIYELTIGSDASSDASSFERQIIAELSCDETVVGEEFRRFKSMSQANMCTMIDPRMLDRPASMLDQSVRKTINGLLAQKVLRARDLLERTPGEAVAILGRMIVTFRPYHAQDDMKVNAPRPRRKWASRDMVRRALMRLKSEDKELYDLLVKYYVTYRKVRSHEHRLRKLSENHRSYRHGDLDKLLKKAQKALLHQVERSAQYNDELTIESHGRHIAVRHFIPWASIFHLGVSRPGLLHDLFGVPGEHVIRDS